MVPPRVSIVGAGPAGLAAAIELARHGVAAVVHEQHGAVGGRFAGDFQALENWTTDEDVLIWLERLGLSDAFPTVAAHGLTLVDPDLTRRAVTAERPLLYLVRRGGEAESLDRGLAERAAALGVEFRFRSRPRPEELSGPVIVATGPRGTQGVAAGIVAETSHPDQIVAIASDALAPKCYAYCVVSQGRATLATGLARDFGQAWSCFARARETFARLGLSDFRAERRFGGRMHVAQRDPLVDGPRWYVGEAAGLQDYLFAFGLRYAFASGHLAARALLTGESYEAMVRRELRPGLRAGFVNRLLYDRLGDAGYRGVVRWLGRSRDVRRRAGSVYAFGPLHRLLWPVARVAVRAGGHT
jgi:flavin-dependent dehydrogenase